ncbi:maltose acetyltransferase-domain-containing protein [Aspergillus lucknowensis]|uniref:Maltose acetyltransferase-domain-containing protein n=1 Tax=Aspergillus lucknowensis TaxID=176173 RepID=A0ABR4LTH8_9EURO
MLPKSEKDRHAIEKAARLRGTCWGEEYERMISGMLYSPLAPELIQGREKARRLIAEFNAPPRPDIPFSKTVANREATLQQLFGHADDGVYIEAPLFIDYGCNTSVGKSFYANFK